MLTFVIGTSICCSSLPIWSFIVLGTLSICGWLKAKVSSDALVLYFVVSVVRSLLFLMRTGAHSHSASLLQLALLLKLGFAPFHFWVYKVIISLSPTSLCVFLGPLKLGILWLLVNIDYPSILLFSASLFLGLILLWSSSNLHLLLFGSGARQLIILVLLGPFFFPSYFLIYLVALLGVALVSYRIISPFLAFACLSGIPPLTMFWAKVLAIYQTPLIWAALIIFVSSLSLWPYMHCSLSLPSSSTTSFVPVSLLSLLPCFITYLTL